MTRDAAAIIGPGRLQRCSRGCALKRLYNNVFWYDGQTFQVDVRPLSRNQGNFTNWAGELPVSPAKPERKSTLVPAVQDAVESYPSSLVTITQVNFYFGK